MTCPVIADTTILAAQAERSWNAGGAKRLMARGTTHFALLNFDLSRLHGLTVTKATLKLKRDADGLIRVGVSTVASRWREGDGGSGEEKAQHEHFQITPKEDQVNEAACYSHAVFSPNAQARVPWAGPGSDFTDVVFGQGGSRWAACVTQLRQPGGWYAIDVPPELIQSLVLGLQPGGLCIADDFNRDLPNPTVWSRESDHPPVLEVEARKTSPSAVIQPRGVAARRDRMGLDRVYFEAAEALGFEVFLSEKPIGSAADLSDAEQLPIWLMPTPADGALWSLLSYHRRAEHTHVAVRAVNGSGDWSAPVSVPLPKRFTPPPGFAPPTLPRHDLPATITQPFTTHEAVAISEDGLYMRSIRSSWWDPLKGPIALQSGRNEFMAFQVVLAGGPGTYAVQIDDWTSPGAAEPAPRVQLFREQHVNARVGREKYAPEGLVPIANGEKLKLNLLTPELATRPSSQPVRRIVARPVWVDVYVPHRAARGLWKSRVTVTRDGTGVLTTPIELEVLDPTLPDDLNFQISLTAVVPPVAIFKKKDDAWQVLHDYHRLAHEHRATLAVMPYSRLFELFEGFAPRVEQTPDGLSLDFSQWDRLFGRYFDGSAFRGLPRDGVPLQHFYLPMYEHWPLPAQVALAAPGAPLALKYHPRATWFDEKRVRANPRPDSYAAWPLERAAPDEFKKAAAAAVRSFAEHIASRGWNRTRFQVYLNNVSRMASEATWWRLNDPQAHDDFLAMRFWLGLFRKGLPHDAGRAHIDVRADINLPQYQRDTLDGLLDITVTSAALLEKNDLLLTHPQRFGTLWVAGGQISPEFGWNEIYKWAWSARLAGARGLSIQHALGRDRDWDNAADASLLLPAERFGKRGAYPSVRLKALRTVQQDMEWLEKRIAAGQERGVPEGYELMVVGRELILRTKARIPNRTTLLPLVGFDKVVDSVALEEIRRGLRAGGGAPSTASGR